MKRLTCLIIFILFVFIGSAAANPPKEIKLTYDKSKKVLTVEIKHNTRDLTEHYIRKISVYKNTEEPNHFSFVSQPAATGLTKEISVDLVPGDVVRVKAVCSEAGFKEETLIVP